MTVVNVIPEWSTATASVDAGKRSAILSWTVELRDTSFFYAPIEAQLAHGIPRFNEQHIIDPSLLVVGIKPEAIGPLLWRITVSYVSMQAEDSPFMVPWEVSWGSEEEVKEVEDDIFGYPILNTAGDPFDPPNAIPHADPKLSITRNEASINPFIHDIYAFTVNSDQFIGLAAGQCLMQPIIATRVKQGDLLFWSVSYNIVIRHPRNTTPDRAWWTRDLNKGLRARSAVGESAQAITGEEGQTAPEPVLLDEDGLVLSDERIAIGDVVWIEKQVYKSAPFSILALGNF